MLLNSIMSKKIKEDGDEDEAPTQTDKERVLVKYKKKEYVKFK